MRSDEDLLSNKNTRALSIPSPVLTAFSRTPAAPTTHQTGINLNLA
jgi:hypothetical protein